jgi:sRNA-binding carbon storage regulator CsrA
MLILTRKSQDEIVITVPPSTEEREIRVIVTKASGLVKLGFEADESINIVRAELLGSG